MKAITKIGCFILLGASLFTCIPQAVKAQNTFDADEAESVTRMNLNNFTSIIHEGVMNVEFVPGDTYSLKLTGKKKDLDRIRIEQKDGVLFFKTKKDDEKNNNGKNNQAPTARVTAPYLKEIQLKGVGNFYMSGKQKSADLNVQLKGVGNVNLNGVEVADLSISLKGVGNVNVDVLKANHVTLEQPGVGSSNLKSITAGDIQIECKGVGNLKGDDITSSESVSVLNSATGNVNLNTIRCGLFSIVNTGIGKFTVENLKTKHTEVKGSGHNQTNLSGTTGTISFNQNGGFLNTIGLKVSGK